MQHLNFEPALWCKPVEESLLQHHYEAGDFFHSLKIHGRHPLAHREVESCDIAIIGLGEYRGGCAGSEAIQQAADVWRKHFYRLKTHHNHYQIVDLGNLIMGDTLEDTYTRLHMVCEQLLRMKTLPLIVGGTHDLLYGQFRAFERLEQMITLANIDAVVDLGEEKAPPCKQHLYKVLMHQPNYIFDFVQLGHQAYLNDAKTLEVLEKLNFSVLSLGQMRNDWLEVEPLIRGAQLVAFDLKAMSSLAAPGHGAGHLFGFSGEEACHLAWFAGLSPNVRSVGFYEFNPQKDPSGQTAFLLATMVWYFVDGFYRRRPVNFQSEDFIHYRVPIGKGKQVYELHFYKQQTTEMWWVEVPYSRSDVFTEPHYLPCSYKDYQHALEGEVPERWIQASAKLL
ncbi:formiminoglutamase [Thermonema lapsum]|uniref:Formiminoglutamase n=1 Tax=Thermonema lapsum TaxID=28195 RepID=A0A846MP54_9BACT|nr:formimidoylglutamase [Thermonema lapsum]NIK73182.1 formiminoglutamase [Thermonema lapsum]